MLKIIITKAKFFIYPRCCPFSAIFIVVVISLLGVLACSAQTGIYLFTGENTTITLNPGTYDITAYGAQGGSGYRGVGSFGAKMEAEFYFSKTTILTLLVASSGGNGYNGGGGGGSFVVNDTTPLVIAGGGGGSGFAYSGSTGSTGANGGSGVGLSPGAGGTGGDGGGYYDGFSGFTVGGGGGGYSGNGSGIYGFGGGSSYMNGGAGGGGVGVGGNGGFGGGGGGYYGAGGGGGYSGGGGGGPGGLGGGGGGGGSIIDPAAITILSEISGIASPNGSPNGEIIITAVPEPSTLALAVLSGLSLLRLRRQRKSTHWDNSRLDAYST